MGKQDWQVSVWGVRGSAPAPGGAFATYGGNTSCFSVDWGDALAVLDAGSGLAGLGEEMARRGRKRADILFSHLHLDHVMGLFTFLPFHDPGAELHLYGAPGLAGELGRLLGPPWWPVGLSGFPARVVFHTVGPGEAFPLAGGAAPGLTVSVMEGNHPNGCLYYRLDRGGRSLVYALDCELEGDMAGRLADFARGADVLVWDVCFFPGEVKKGWGHSTWEEGLAVGRKAGAKQVLMTHYGPGQTDLFVREQEKLAAWADGRCRFAREGMVIRL